MSDIISDGGFSDGFGGDEYNPAAALGRISGKLLKENLLRNGVDLTFRNSSTDSDLLYLDVNNSRIGINKENPNFALEVVGKTNISNSFIANGTIATFDNVVFNSNGSVTSTVGPIIIEPQGSNPYVQYGKVTNPKLELKDNYIQVTATNTNLILDPHGTGIVDFQSTLNINNDLSVGGNISASGNLQFNGALTIGDNAIDTVVVSPDFTQSIIPGDNNLYDLGKPNKRWAEFWFYNDPGVTYINTTNLIISGQTLITGHTISTIQSNDDLILDSSSGNITLERITINGGVITNLENTPITITQTAAGWTKFDTNTGVVVPVGNNAERPYIEEGDTRWNTQKGYLECFDGNVYTVATGGGVVVTLPIMEELTNLWALVVG
jgi:hypothetical protein